MKENIHPEYNEIKVECTCGNSFTVGSTLGSELHLEVCNKCHRFYTGKQKFNTAGRVDSFNRRFGLVKKDENDSK